MLTAIFALVRVFAFDPYLASYAGATLAGEPTFGAELVSICRRESLCRPVGIHPKDAWAGKTMQRKALRIGWLSQTCIFHGGAPDRYSIRGIHGLSAAYSLHFIGGCLPPEMLDVPIFSAFAATRRAEAQCRKHGACDRKARHRFWSGARRYDRRITRRTAADTSAA